MSPESSSTPSTPGLEPASPEAASSIEAPPRVEFTPLDRRVVNYWRLHSLITSAVLIGLALTAGVILVVSVREALPWVGLGWLLLFLSRLFVLIWLPARSHRAWSYRVDDTVLETRSGIWFRTITLLPLSRLQHVDLHRGPLERAFGIASLLLHTAGTQQASIVIPGLDAEHAARLRDQLVAAGGDDAV